MTDSARVPANGPTVPDADEQRKYAKRLIEDIDVIENGFELTGLPGRNLAVYEHDSRMVARWLNAALDEIERLREALRETRAELVICVSDLSIEAARNGIAVIDNALEGGNG